MEKALAALVMAAGSLMAQDAVTSRDWMNRGVQAFRQAQYPEAVAAFTKAVQADPSFLPAHLYLGTAYMQMHVPGAESPENNAMAESAHTEFRKVLAMDANNMVALQSEASLFLNQKQWDAAQQFYEKVIALDPNNANAYYTLGYIAWSKWYPAYSQARRDAGMQPQNPGPIRDAGTRQELKARWDGVLQDGLTALDKALAINPRFDDAMAYENLLIRERADLRDTVEECQADVRVADQWVQKALATKRAKAGGGGRPTRIRYAALLKRVDPEYPIPARQARVQGTVAIDLTIGTDGHPKDLSVITGHPLLVSAALNAVKQWVYVPTLLNGEPIEVRLQVDVPFTLSQ